MTKLMKNTLQTSILIVIVIFLIISIPKQFCQITNAAEKTHSPLKDLSYNQLYDTIIQHIKFTEGFCATPYIDSNGKPTLGYGHQLLNGENIETIDKKTAEKILHRDFRKKVKAAESMGLDGAKSLAIAMFMYNVGEAKYAKSTLKKLVDSNGKIDHEIIKWCNFFNIKKGKRERSSGLFKRRIFELNVYNAH